MFRRKRTVDEEAAAAQARPAEPEPVVGPVDVEDLPDDGVKRVDLGSLVIEPQPGRELRMQVNEQSGAVQAVLLSGQDGAVEVRAFAAPRNGDLWSEVRPQIAADLTQRGGTAIEREGRWGTELVCEMNVRTDDGGQVVQPSRIVGINGPRWMLRATFLGTPAVETEGVEEWEESLTKVAVRRGTEAMPVGEPLPIELPEQARRVGRTPAGPAPEPGAGKAGDG
jgi:hypothetical protein